MEANVVYENLPVDVRTAYDFAKQMDNLPQWASGLATGIEQRGDRWFSQSPMGEVEIRMAKENEFGVLDHDVILPNGQSVHNALRITPAGDGSVVSFVVLKMPGTTDEAHNADMAHVKKDLLKLGEVLGKRGK